VTLVVLQVLLVELVDVGVHQLLHPHLGLALPRQQLAGEVGVVLEAAPDLGCQIADDRLPGHLVALDESRCFVLERRARRTSIGNVQSDKISVC
jgi:hypothetical protein